MLHRKKTGIVLCLIGWFFFSGILVQTHLDSAGTKQTADLILMYTASLKGNLDGCHCVKLRRAGLVKRAYYLRRLKRTKNMLLVDAGDLLEPRKGDKLRSEYILQTYRELKYDAIALGDNELANGILDFREKNPFLAANLKMLMNTGGLVPSGEPLIMNNGRYRVGIFAVLEQQFKSAAPMTDLLAEKFQIIPVRETALNAVQFLKSRKTNLIILLYHGFYENAVKLARDVPGIDVIVLGHEEKLIDAQVIGRTVLVSPGEEGNRIGILELSLLGNKVTVLKNGFRIFKYEEDPDDPAVRKLIDQYYNNMVAPVENNPKPIRAGVSP